MTTTHPLAYGLAAVFLLGGTAWPGAPVAIVSSPLGYMVAGAVVSFLITAAALHVAQRRIHDKTAVGFRALLESFQHLADSQRIGLIYWNKDGLITDANDTFLQLLGYTRDEIRGGALRLADLTPPQHVERDYRARAELEATGVAAPYEKEYVHKDGRLLPVLQGLALLEDARHHGLVFVHDLTERKKYERALRDSEALYQSLVEHIPLQVYRKDRAGRLQFGNQSFYTMLGSPAADALGKTVYDYYPKHLADKYDADDRRVLETGAVFHDVEEHHDGKGNRLFVEVLKCPVRDHGGQIVGTQGIFWDVTARKEAELGLKQSEQRFAAFMSHLPGAAFVKDAAGCYLYANTAFAKLLATTPKELAGKTDQQLGRLAAPFAGPVVLPEAGPPAAVTVTTTDDQGDQHHWLLHRFPIHTGSGTSLVGGIALDVSELRRTQQALEDERNFMAAVHDAARLLVVVVDRQGRIVRFNRTCEKTSGYSFEEVKGKPLWELIAVAEEAELVRTAFAGALDKLPRGFIDHWQVKTGGQRLIELTNTLLPGATAEAGQHIVCTGVDITDRRLAEEALNETQTRQRQVFEQVPAILWTTDRDLKFTSGTGGDLAQFGVVPNQTGFIGLSVHSYLHTEDPQHPAIAAHRRALAGEKAIVDMEWLGRLLQVTIEPFHDAAGQVIGTIGVGVDITERKRTESELAESLALLETLLTTAPVGIAYYDRQLRYVRINDSLVAINGVARADTIGKTVHEVLPGPLADTVHGLMSRVLATGAPISNLEFSGVTAACASEPPHHWLTHYHPVYIEGEVVGVLAAVTDITDIKRVSEDYRRLNVELEQRVSQRTQELERSQEELRRQSSILQSVLFSMAEGVVVTDETGHFLLFNPAGEQLVGHGPLDVGPERWSESYGIYDCDGQTLYPAAELPLARAMRGIECNNVELIIRNAVKPAGVCLSVSARPLRDGPRGAVAVFHDITERKQAEEQLRGLHRALEERAAQLEDANRELEAFSYSVSHDLRAPLRAIDGFARILEQDHAPGLVEPARHCLERVRANAQHMGQLIDNLLSFSRLGRQPLQKQPVNTGELVESVLEDLRGERDGRHVEIHLGELPACQGDPLLLRQVFVNLLSNAFKYTRGRDPARIEVGSQPGDRGATVYFVRDNGVGFDMRYAGKLFGVFQRLHRAEDYDGTGVGLASAQRIVRRHGGRIWADAQVDQGACFSFTLEGEATERTAW